MQTLTIPKRAGGAVALIIIAPPVPIVILSMIPLPPARNATGTIILAAVRAVVNIQSGGCLFGLPPGLNSLIREGFRLNYPKLKELDYLLRDIFWK
jgi:hypothetical protein